MVRPLLKLAWLPLLIGACAAPPVVRPAPAEPLTRPSAPEPCERFESELTCPPLSRISVTYGPKSEEGTRFCELSCMTADGTRDGGYALYHAAKNELVRSGSYTAGQQTGTWREFGENQETFEPTTLSETVFRNGQRHGLARRWYNSGTLASTGAWVDGERDGDWETYAPDGTWLSRGTFDQGTPIGIHLERFLNGQLISKRSYDEQGRPDGEWCFWRSDGTEISCQEIVGGNGTLTEYDRKGDVSRISELQNGRLHGQLTEFTYNTRYVAEYVDGEQHGTTTVYVDECPERQSTWKRGKLDGPYTEVDCDSQVVTVRGQYCDDAMCGRWEAHDGATGKLTETTEYSDDGTLIGRIVYGEDGQIDRF